MHVDTTTRATGVRMDRRYTMIGHDRYGCAGHRERGLCTNRIAIKRTEIEERVLDGIKENLMAPELVEEFARSFVEEANRRSR